MNRLSKYNDFNELKRDIEKIYTNINIDILDNLDQLTQGFNDYTSMDIIKNMQVVVSMSNQFELNKWEFVQRVKILGHLESDKFVKESMELTHRNIIAFKELLENYNDNGLFYRLAIMTKDNNNILDNGDEEYFPFSEESETLIPILEYCSKRISRLHKLKFNGVFVGYYSGLKPRWYPSESIKDWMVDIEDVNGIRNIQLYFQDKSVPEI